MPGLPPRPDSQTGQPRPPAAPVQYRGGEAEKTPSRVPDPPEGQGPVLECYRESKRSVWLSAPIPIVLLLVVFILDSGFEALTYWFTWAILIPYFAFLVYKGRSDVLTAGADWVQFKGHWVRTYELISVKYAVRGQGLSHEVVLTDRNGGIGIPLRLIQSNPRLWDYVYLGIRHSVANGAKTNAALRNAFPELATDAPNASGDR
ncbi:hypothetical protein ACFQ16_00370 [Saccharopolyspora rosea]|uniref:PH domain-containing protein n=1 Tax=Saccharopolyspora rosea TaxID=524884 RepID=A0ABW3FI73_9PSEU